MSPIALILLGLCGIAFLGAVGAFVFLVVALIRKFAPPRCPFCQRRGGVEEIDREAISRKKAYGLVSRGSTAIGAFFPPGQAPAGMAGSISRKERVPVIVTTWRVRRICSRCGKEWQVEQRTEQEDFHRQ